MPRELYTLSVCSVVFATPTAIASATSALIRPVDFLFVNVNYQADRDRACMDIGHVTWRCRIRATVRSPAGVRRLFRLGTGARCFHHFRGSGRGRACVVPRARHQIEGGSSRITCSANRMSARSSYANFVRIALQASIASRSHSRPARCCIGLMFQTLPTL